MFKELEDRGLKYIDLDVTFILAQMLKEHHEKLQDQRENEHTSEYVDAFVALGGNADQTGVILKQNLLNVILNEFQLTFDMAQFLEKIEVGTDEIDYPQFCLLFEGGEEGRTMTKASSVLSVNIFASYYIILSFVVLYTYLK